MATQVRPELGRIDWSPIERGGAAIGQGIASMGQNIAGGIGKATQQMDQRKQMQADIKTTKGLVEALKPTLQQMGLPEGSLAQIDTLFKDGSLYDQYSASQKIMPMVNSIFTTGLQSMMNKGKDQAMAGIGEVLNHVAIAEDSDNAFLPPRYDLAEGLRLLDERGFGDEAKKEFRLQVDALNRFSDAQRGTVEGTPLENQQEYVGPNGDRKMMGFVQTGPNAGKQGWVDDKGNFNPRPEGWMPSYETPATRTEMKSLKDALIADERSIKAANRYMQNRIDARQGIEALTDDIMGRFKTVFNSGNLSPQELVLAVTKGQFQGLLGQFRLETVGGGVMTEKDAERIIMRLGGEPGLFSNKEVVQALVTEIIQDKFDGYQNNLLDYNIARGTLPSSQKQNYPEWKALELGFPGAGSVTQNTEFKSVAEAEAANLPVGTRITIGGRPAIIQP